jgi:flagellum-specific ATP synthase
LNATARHAAALNEHFSRAIRKVQALPPPPVEGVLTRMVGLTLEAVGCQAAVGDRCEAGTGVSRKKAEAAAASAMLAALRPQAQTLPSALPAVTPYIPGAAQI